jgi:hypothetical protein
MEILPNPRPWRGPAAAGKTLSLGKPCTRPRLRLSRKDLTPSCRTFCRPVQTGHWLPSPWPPAVNDLPRPPPFVVPELKPLFDFLRREARAAHPFPSPFHPPRRPQCPALLHPFPEPGTGANPPTPAAPPEPPVQTAPKLPPVHSACSAWRQSAVRRASRPPSRRATCSSVAPCTSSFSSSMSCAVIPSRSRGAGGMNASSAASQYFRKNSCARFTTARL